MYGPLISKKLVLILGEDMKDELFSGVEGKINRIEFLTWPRKMGIYQTPLTLFTGLGGAAIFIGSIVALLVYRQPKSVLIFGVGGLIMAGLGRVYAAWHEQRDWVEVQAKCIDLEYEAIPNGHDMRNEQWIFRTLCEYSRNGKTHQITPSSSNMTGFTSEDGLKSYLDETMSDSGQCTLWINPNNPREGLYHEKKKI